MSRAIYPGSFDPFTYGHIDIIQRIHNLFDEVIIVVANSANKKYLLTSEERAGLIQESLSELNLSNVRVEIFDGLIVNFAQQVGASVIVRGLRAVADFEYEMAMASTNKKLAPGIETLIAFTSPEYNYLSSRTVKEVATYNGDLKPLVPKNVEDILKAKIRKKNS